MKTRASLTPSAFTLIELLTVISIIAILMGLLFPAISIVKNTANKARAGTDVANIVTAVKQYNAEYGKFPALEKASGKADPEPKDAMCGDKAALMELDNNTLFYTLRAIAKGEVNTEPNDHAMNPRKVNFFDGKAASDPTQPRGGFADKQGVDKEGCYFDPWGKQYNIVIDTNYNNVLDLEKKYQDFETPNEPRVTVGAFSVGKDSILGDKKFEKTFRKGQTTSDDVVSWQ